ncbi:hypothetical protein ACT7C9_01800 [Bacillus cereus]
MGAIVDAILKMLFDVFQGGIRTMLDWITRIVPKKALVQFKQMFRKRQHSFHKQLLITLG